MDAHSMFGRSATMDRLYNAVREAHEETIKQNVDRTQHLMEKDIAAAWKVLAPNGEPNITKSDLIERLSHYIPHVDLGVVTFLMGGNTTMTEERLHRLLWHDHKPTLPCNMGDLTWQLLDPHHRGAIGLDQLLRMLTTIPGCEKLDSEDMRVVRLLLDLSPYDHQITSENWEQLGSWEPKLEVLTPVQRKMLAAKSAEVANAGASRVPGGRRTPILR